jgi:hypothetical protein
MQNNNNIVMAINWIKQQPYEGSEGTYIRQAVSIYKLNQVEETLLRAKFG